MRNTPEGVRTLSEKNRSSPAPEKGNMISNMIDNERWHEMSWTKREKTTKHTCGGPKFGKLTPGCPSCDEILDGKREPVRWGGTRAKEMEAERVRAIRAHDCRKSGCGLVCTAFDW